MFGYLNDADQTTLENNLLNFVKKEQNVVLLT